ncbi:MAG: hypothetical protein KH295_12700 [Clostridiaceae bacterium]|nr:hypothetical protein [Clostridiaceae bacterium]
MKMLRKRYSNEANTLRAFASCNCHAAACLCNQYFPTEFTAASVEDQQIKATYADTQAWNE